MNIGYDQPLYILPFDHRGSFQTGLFGWTGTLGLEQTAQIAEAKQVVYDGFRAALEAGIPAAKAGILVDEQFGKTILIEAHERKLITACPAEKSGQEVFDFEYGVDFAAHLEGVTPTFCKVLVRYNPEGDAALNALQTARLKTLSDYLRSSSRLFMFELLVPAEATQLARVDGEKLRYDLELRPSLMVATIRALQTAGIEPDVWKIEGLDRREDCQRIVEVARQDGRHHVGCIILGRGENDAKVREWLEVAASVPGFTGFAVGRTTFWEPLVAWRAGTNSREATVAEIARRYRSWVDVFERARST